MSRFMPTRVVLAEQWKQEQSRLRKEETAYLAWLETLDPEMRKMPSASLRKIFTAERRKERNEIKP